MALRRSLKLLPRLCGMAGSEAAPCAGLSVRAPSFAAQDEQRPSTKPNALAILRAFASNAPVSVNPAVGAIAETPTGLPPTLHVRTNPTHKVMYDESAHERFPVGDPNKRAFTYFVLTGSRFAYASAMRLVVLKFLLSWAASSDVLALAALEVDLTTIKPGNTITVKWRGKPVFIKHRTESEIAREEAVPLSDLRDPEADGDRCKDPKWMVCLGVCTHLGCVPVANAGDFHGWFCPCHGSHYDGSGRIRRGPAPYNLEIPEYRFEEGDVMIIG